MTSFFPAALPLVMTVFMADWLGFFTLNQGLARVYFSEVELDTVGGA